MEALFGKKKRKPGGALVLYTTRHGSTQRYAERIAEPLDALVKDAAYMSADKAKTYDAIVLGCCVYEGKIRGLDLFAEHAKDLADKRLVIFTCGIYDPEEPDVRAELDGQIRSALGDAAEAVAVFHLRGAVRWRSLGVLEHVKMKKWIASIRGMEEGARSVAQAQLLETEGGTMDFTDEADIWPIVHAARFGKETER